MASTEGDDEQTIDELLADPEWWATAGPVMAELLEAAGTLAEALAGPIAEAQAMDGGAGDAMD